MRQRAPTWMGAVWLALALQAAAASASALPLWPLALELQGRPYGLPKDGRPLELPLGCGGRPLALAVQHRVPAAQQQQPCRGVLSVLPGGASGSAPSLWQAGQIGAPTPGADADAAQLQASGGSAAAPPPNFWFRFELDPAAFQPGGAYTLQLALSCGPPGARPTLQSALAVVAAPGCAAGAQPAAAAAAQAVAVWPGVRLPGDGGVALSGATLRSRQLAEGDVPVVLYPTAAAGAVLLDAYSGPARPINASDAAPPCGTPGLPSGERCLGSPAVRSASPLLRLTLRLLGGAAMSGAVPPSAFVVTGGSVAEAPETSADGGSVDVLVRLDGTGEASVSVPQGALAGNGVQNAASNTLAVQLDTSPPVPVITSPGHPGATASTQLSFSIDFGEPVLATDPFSLFSYAGAARWDAVLELATGRLDVTAYVLNTSQQADVSVWVSAGAVSDLVGNTNTATDTLTIKYRPDSSALQGAAIAANALLGASLALCTAASYLSSALLPFSASVLGCGALSAVGWAQTFYLSAGLSAQWMPERYRQAAGTFGWTVGEISLTWADSQPEMNPAFAFPWLPVALTSAGQEVDVAQYPAASPAALNASSLVALTGELSGLAGQGAAAASVLDGVPFLNPAQVQALGAPPAPASAAPNLPTLVPSPSPLPAPGAAPAAAPTAAPTPGPPPAGFSVQSDPAVVPSPPADVTLPPLLAGGPPPGGAQPARRLKAAPALRVESPSAARRRLAAEARRGRRALLQDAPAPAPPAQQPAFEGTVYLVASRGLQLVTPGEPPTAGDILVGGGAVQRAYDVIDAAGDDGGWPQQYYYDRLARTAFWCALAAFSVMAAHLGLLAWMMWRHARVPNTMWFPRIELVACLAILPGLAYGTSGLFNCGGGGIALGVVLLLLLPLSFLLAAFYLLWRWMHHPALNYRRAIFVLRQDPLAAAIAARTPTATPAATPREPPGGGATPGATPRGGGDFAAGSDAASADGSPKGGANGATGSGKPGGDGGDGSPGDPPPSPPAAAEAEARRAPPRRWSLLGLARALCGARRQRGDWCAINLDSRFTFKYGPLFEATYGQAMARRRATYEFDAARGKIDRGALVPLPELATISWGGRSLVEPHHLRTPAQLVAVARTLVLACAVSGVSSVDSYIQCCLLVLMYGFHAIYLLAVRPYNAAVVGGFEAATTACLLAVSGLAMALMDGRGASDSMRSLIGTVMLAIQLAAFVAILLGTWWVALRAIWAATGLRRRLGLKPSPSDRLADAVTQVMARDPHILARKFLDRWMVRALGVGLYDRPVWRRETEDLRRLLRATALPKRRVSAMGSVVRRKEPPPDEGWEEGDEAAWGAGTPPGDAPSGSGSDAGAGAGAGAGADAVIAVAGGPRSPPRELAAQPGSALHRQLSDATLARAASSLRGDQRWESAVEEQELEAEPERWETAAGELALDGDAPEPQPAAEAPAAEAPTAEGPEAAEAQPSRQ